MTPAEASALHARASANHGLVMWFVTLSDPAHPGHAVAYVMKGDQSGGYRLPGELVADTIEELGAMLPAGLTRHHRSKDRRNWHVAVRLTSGYFLAN